MTLQKKSNILLGVCGGIAAYKSIELLRILIKNGHNVKVLLTPDALNFVNKNTLSILSKNKVYTNFFEDDAEKVTHVHLAEWADIFILYPATANTISKIVHAQSDNLLLTTYFSLNSPVFICPAMDLEMYQNPLIKKNILALNEIENHFIIGPEYGELASGLKGEGRLTEPEEIANILLNFFENFNVFQNKNVIVTAGPTVEKLDPVRYISNNSSGKMGIAVANIFNIMGANVSLILGNVSQKHFSKKIKIYHTLSAEEMHNTTTTLFPKTDIAVLSAAVCDYKPITYSQNKIKKTTNEEFELKLEKTKDILASLGKIKTNKQLLIGFALETNNQIENAKTKLHTKNADMIVLNHLNTNNPLFGENKITASFIEKNNEIKDFEHMSKINLAIEILKFAKKKFC